MNFHLFTAFPADHLRALPHPGPIVTLVITTGATRGIRAALLTVAGATTGNAALLACIAFGLNWF